MKIIEYVKSLIPSFKKDRITEDVELIITELNNVTVPVWNTANETLGTTKFHSKELKDYEKEFFRHVKPGYNENNMIVVISDVVSKTCALFKMLEDRAEKVFEDEILADGITIQKATLLRCIEAVRFMSEYSLLFLNYIYIQETASIKADNMYGKNELSKAELEYIDTSFLQFCQTINIFNTSVDKFKSKLDMIPDVAISVTAGDMVFSSFSEAKTNPLGFNYSTHGFVGNPIYHVGLIVAESQAKKYKRNIELKKALELRLLNLQRLQAGEPEDAKLEKEIAWIQSRVQRLDHEIRKAEEK